MSTNDRDRRRPAPAELWQALFAARFEETRVAFPPNLRGAVEIVVVRHDAPSLTFHLSLCGTTSSIRSGLAPHKELRARVRSTERRLETLLYGPQHHGPPPFLVEGDQALVREVFERMAALPQAQTLVSVRK